MLQPVVLPIGKTLNHCYINKNFIFDECMHEKSTIKTSNPKAINLLAKGSKNLSLMWRASYSSNDSP